MVSKVDTCAKKLPVKMTGAEAIDFNQLEKTLEAQELDVNIFHQLQKYVQILIVEDTSHKKTSCWQESSQIMGDNTVNFATGQNSKSGRTRH